MPARLSCCRHSSLAITYMILTSGPPREAAEHRVCQANTWARLGCGGDARARGRSFYSFHFPVTGVPVCVLDRIKTAFVFKSYTKSGNSWPPHRRTTGKFYWWCRTGLNVQWMYTHSLSQSLSSLLLAVHYSKPCFCDKILPPYAAVPPGRSKCFLHGQ